MSKNYKVLKQFHKKVRIQCVCGQEYTVKLHRNIINPCQCSCTVKAEVNNKAYENYKKSALERNKIFRLTPDYFNHVINQNCYYCDEPPRLYTSENIVRNGIDRMKNDLGYVPENVVACCDVCNRMKGTLDFEVFMKKVKKITQEKEEVDKLSKFQNDEQLAQYAKKVFKKGVLLPSYTVALLLERKLLTKEDIHYDVAASIVLNKDTMDSFLEMLDELLNETIIHKKLIKVLYKIIKKESFIETYRYFTDTRLINFHILFRDFEHIKYKGLFLDKSELIDANKLQKVNESLSKNKFDNRLMKE